MAKNNEIELKLLVSKENLKKMLALDFVKQAVRPGSKKKRKLVSSYYDTEDLSFRKNGVAYRVRDKGDGSFEATVKLSQSSSGGLSQRQEFNVPLTKDEAVLTGFKELGLAVDLEELAPEGVICLFTVRVERTTYILDIGTAVVELAVDKGKITAGEREVPIDEIELELLEGDQASLLHFAAQLSSAVPLFIEKRSKYSKGMELRGIVNTSSPEKPKLCQGPVRADLLGVVAYHGDLLLQQQNSLRSHMDENVLKALNKQLAYMLAYCAFAQTGLAVDCHVAGAVLQEWRTTMEELQQLRQLSADWEEAVEAAGPLLERNSLTKKLGQLVKAREEKLQELVAAGSLTAAYYSLLSRLMRYQPVEEPECADLLEMCAAKWQELPEAQEDLLYLMKSAQGKYYAKQADSVKKRLRQEREQRTITKEQELLQSLFEGSSSKLLCRDLGLLLGWLLAR